MIGLFVALALFVGGRPADVPPTDRLDLTADVSFATVAASGEGPAIEATRDGVRRLRFRSGTAAEVGFAAVPLPGADLRSWGANRLEVECRASGIADTVDVVLLFADESFRAPLDLSRGDWHTVSIPFGEFRRRSAPYDAMPSSCAPLFLRFESRDRGLERPAQLDVRRVSFLRDGAPPRVARASDGGEVAAREGVAIANGRFHRGGEPHFPFGIWSLGGNRTVLEEAARHGVNAVCEYGPATWSRAVVEDHLDFAHACGADVVVNLHDSLHGRDVNADDRLASLGSRDGFLAWHLLDEPDAARGRGMDASRTSPERLAQRARALSGPALVNCMEPFGLARYAAGARVLATDYYWPAYVRAPTPLLIASHAEAIVELASRQGAAPMIVLQLADADWRDPVRRQTPQSLRAQVLAALAGGIRGIVVYQGVTAARWKDEGASEGSIWPAFLDLASDVATWAPLVARWERTPDLEGRPALGSVRAASFEESGARWIVFVNLGREPVDVVLGGEALRGASAIEDPLDGWRGEVRDGRWSGRVASFAGRLVRVVSTDGAEARRPVAVATTPTSRRAPLGFDRAIVGASIYPAPDRGSVTLWLDGARLDAVEAWGPAATARADVRELERGTHEALVRWRMDGAPFERAWAFDVDGPSLPFEDDFDRAELGERWTPVDSVRWDPFDPSARDASGAAEIDRGSLRLASTGGAFGVVLRGIEAPESFVATWTATCERDVTLVLKRSEVARRFTIPAGTHRVEWREDPGGQQAFVDGRRVGEWKPPLDHRGGVFGFGVGAGQALRIDEVRIRRSISP